MLSRFLVAIAAMVATVAASNFLVQFPVQFTLGDVNLGDNLYPVDVTVVAVLKGEQPIAPTKIATICIEAPGRLGRLRLMIHSTTAAGMEIAIEPDYLFDAIAAAQRASSYLLNLRRGKEAA